MRLRLAPLALAGALFASCGDGPGPGDPDAGVDAGGDFEPTPPAAPRAPEPPAVPAQPDLACAPGWRGVPDASDPALVVCDPWPEGGPVECADGEAHFPGGAGCEPLGDPCPAGAFEEDAPADAIFVDPAAAPGGDGTRAAPLWTIAEALVLAPDGGVVALARGIFDEVVTVGTPVTIRGACAAETVLAPSAASETEATVTFGDRGGGALENLRIAAPRPGIHVGLVDDPVSITSVLVTSAIEKGLWVDAGGAATARAIVVRDTEERPSDGDFGYGLQAFGGSTLEVRRAFVTGGRTVGAYAADSGTVLLLSDVAIRETRPRENDLRNGYGVDVFAGARAELERVVVEESHAAGILAKDAGTVLVATDVVVRETDSHASDGLAGQGIDVLDGADATLDRVWLAGNRHSGLEADGAATRVTANDLVVTDTLPQRSADLFGMGIVVTGAAHVTASRVALVRNRTAAAFVQEPGTDVVLGDATLSDTAPDTAGQGGFGLELTGGAVATLDRARVSSNRAAGLAVSSAETVLHATDLTVEGTRAVEATGDFGDGLELSLDATGDLVRAAFEGNETGGVHVIAAHLDASDLWIVETRPREIDGIFGRGLKLAEGAAGVVSGAVVEGNASTGVFLGGASTLSATDLVIRGTQPRPFDSNLGEGMVVTGGSDATLERALLAGNRRVGLLAHDGSVVSLTDVEITGTVESGCDGDLCGGANGLDAVVGAHAQVTRFRLSDNAWCGVQIASGGEVDFDDGEISGNAIGANVSSEGFDLARLQNRVVYRDNDATLDTSALPVPVPLDE